MLLHLPRVTPLCLFLYSVPFCELFARHQWKGIQLFHVELCNRSLNAAFLKKFLYKYLSVHLSICFP